LVNNSFTALSFHLGPGCRPWRSVRKVLRQRGWSKSTFYRKLDGGAAHCRHPGRARRRDAVIGGRVRPDSGLSSSPVAGGRVCRAKSISGRRVSTPPAAR